MGLEERIRAQLRDGGASWAIMARGEATSWNRLERSASAVDQALSGAELGRGPVVGVLGRNRAVAAGAFLGLLASGRCAALLNPFQPAERIVADANAAGASAVIIEPQDAESPAWKALQGRAWVMNSDSLTRHQGAGLAGPRHRAAILAATSGTTGLPKRIPLQYETLDRALVDIGGFQRGFGDLDRPGAEQPPMIQYSPLAHIAGAITLARLGAEGRRVVMLEKFDPQEWIEIVRTHRPRVTGLPPAMMRMVVDARPDPSVLQSLVSVWCGTAPVDASVARTFTECYGIPVLGNYGATEFCGAVATWSLDDYKRVRAEKAGAVGRISPDVASARVIDVETGAVLSNGDVGVLELKVHRVGPKWLKTTDLAHLDDDGFLFLHGRADDAINRGGFKVLPDVVAGVLKRHPALADAVVIGLADDRLGQVPVAAVEARAGVVRPTEAQIIAFVRSQLPAYQAPAAVQILDALPRTPLMKIDRRAVQALFSPP